MRTPIGEMTRDGRVIVHRLDNEVVVTAKDAAEVQRITAELAGGEPVAVVVDMRSLGFADREVRQAFSDDIDGIEVATALLVSPALSAGLAALFSKFQEPSRPVKIFTDEAQAIEWAAEQVAG